METPLETITRLAIHNPKNPIEMAKFEIGQISGDHNVFGDQNQIVNNFSSIQNFEKVLSRDDYFSIISEIVELERLTLGDYLCDRYQKAIQKNPNFVKLLYKDIYRVLEGHEAGSDLAIENGDLVVEYGDVKLTGNPTNLHYALCWLHMQLIEGLGELDPSAVGSSLEKFEKEFLLIDYDPPSVKNKIELLRKQLSEEESKPEKADQETPRIDEIFHFKPNFYGIGLDLNALIKMIFPKRKK